MERLLKRHSSELRTDVKGVIASLDGNLRHLEVGRSVIRMEADALGQLADHIGDAFGSAVEMILGCRQRVIVSGIGKAGHVARKIAATLAATATPALFVHPAEAAHGDVGMISPGDVLIVLSASGATAEVQPLCIYAKAIGCAVIGVSCNPNSLLMRTADVGLLLPKVEESCPSGLAPTTSSTMMLALGDALAVAAMRARGMSGSDTRSESQRDHETLIASVPSRESSHSSERSTLVALSALVTEQEIWPIESMGDVRATVTKEIKAISVFGAERLEATAVLSYVKLRLGQPYNSDAVAEAVVDLLATELFADVQIGDEDGELTIRVRENPVINRIVFEGNKSLQEDQLFEELKLVPRQILTRSKVRADVVRLVDLYRRRGRFAAKVEPKLVTHRGNRVDIVFEIEEGPKSKVQNINSIGNEAYELGEVTTKDGSITRLRDSMSLGSFQENLEIIERQSSSSDRIVLEAKFEGRSKGGLDYASGSSSLECFILNASILYRLKGKRISSLMDISDKTRAFDYPLTGSEGSEDLNTPDFGVPRQNLPVPNSRIVVVKVIADAFLDRRSILLKSIGASDSLAYNDKSKKIDSASYFRKIREIIDFDYALSFEKWLVYVIFSKGFDKQLEKIILAERCLKFDDDSTKRDVLLRSLTISLRPVFDEAAYPYPLRPGFVDRIADEILSYGATSQKPWVARVAKGAAAQPLASESQHALPDAPPAIWKIDKQAGDTPPDFIKRHYGPWLNSDATGLTRPDIKRLDPSLYMALANWLRKNDLPDDCPVPIKSQRLDSELARVAEGGLANVVSGGDPAAILKDAQRLLSAKRRRER